MIYVGVVTAQFLVGAIADLRSDMRDLARRVTSLEGELYELRHDGDDGWPEETPSGREIDSLRGS